MSAVSNEDRARVLLRLAAHDGPLPVDDVPASDRVVVYDLAAKVLVEGARIDCRPALRLTDAGRTAVAALAEAVTR